MIGTTAYTFAALDTSPGSFNARPDKGFGALARHTLEHALYT